MPLYEYLCSACGHRFERIVKFSDATLTTCPGCGKETIKQVISAPAVQFKGSGWYVTDYARKALPGTPSAAQLKSGSESAPATGGSSKSDGSSSTSSSESSASGSGEKSSSNGASGADGGNASGGSSGSNSSNSSSAENK